MGTGSPSSLEEPGKPRGPVRDADVPHRESPGSPACPKCGGSTSRMPLMDLPGVGAAYCGDCGGMWLDAGRLDPSVLGRADLVLSPGKLPAVCRPTRFRCPAGHGKLVEHEAPVGSSIHVDQCPDCGGVFLDRGEYRRIRRFLGTAAARPPRIPPAPAAPAAPKGDDVVAGYDAESGWVKLFQYVFRLPVELDARQNLLSPAVTLLLVANVAVFLVSLGSGLEAAVARFGLVPALLAERPATVLTSAFLHAGPGHLIGNMYFLLVAGDNVEERLGSAGFLLLYALSLAAADAAWLARNLGSTIPLVGASGAISGILGAYIVFFPRNRFLVRWFYFLWWNVSLRIPAWVYFSGWIALQFLLQALDVPGVAWLAHIGGFLTGALAAAAVEVLSASRAAEGRARWDG